MLATYAGLGIARAVLTIEAPPAAPHAPAPPAQCQETLRAAGVKFSPWPLRPSKMPNGVVCEAPGGVAVRRGRALRYQPEARVNCAFAQRLVRLERIVDEEARAVFHSPVRAIVQLGTYNCRRMAAYPDLVSEHSFANAIDVEQVFTVVLTPSYDKHHKNHLHLDGAGYSVDGT